MKHLTIFLAIAIAACNPTQPGSTANEKVEKDTLKSESTVLEANPAAENTALQNGDIIFHTSQSNQSLAIQLATQSIYSHVGIIYKESDKLLVYEAVQPIKLTPLTEFIDRGREASTSSSG